MSTIRFKEQSTTPADASAGQVQMYAKTDGELYVKQGGNSEQNLATASDISGLSLGKVLQVIESYSTTQVVISSETYADSGLSVTITPASTSSKILLMATYQAEFYQWAGMSTRFLRDSTALFTPGDGQSLMHGSNAHTSKEHHHGTDQLLDSPNTTSEVVYKLQIRGDIGGAPSQVHTINFLKNGDYRGSLIAMEIGG